MQAIDAEAIASLIRDTQHLLKERSGEYLQQRGVSFSYIVVIRSLYATPSMTVSELSRRVGFSKGYISVLVDELEQEGWLLKQSDPEDQRLIRLQLTSAGQQIHDSLHAGYQQFLCQLMQHIPATEAATILSGLRSLRDGLRHNALQDQKGR